MSKKYSWSSKMSATEGFLVEKARSWIDILCREEASGPGEYGEAMRRISQKLRLPFGFLSEMTYRPPKRISAGRFLTLAAAHDEYLQRQKYREERATFEPNTALGRLVVRTANYLAGEEGD